MNSASITAVILAGGLGTRLLPAISDRPKALAPVGGRPFITYLLDQLALGGVKCVVLCIGFRGPDMRKALGDNYRGMLLRYSDEHEPMGTGGALRRALPMLEENLLLVMNGDSFVDIDLNLFLKWFTLQSGKAALLLTWVADTDRYGRVEVSGKDRIRKFDEKGEVAGPGWINAGVYLLQRHLVASIPTGKSYSLEREFFPVLIDQGLYGYRCQCPFIDIGTPESYHHAQQFFNQLHFKPGTGG